MRFDQVVVSAAPGDAVTNSALEIRSLLSGVAESNIYARYVHPDLAGDVLDLELFDDVPGARRDTRCDLLIFHGSIGAPEVFSFVMSRPERVVLVYHNISPAQAYRSYDPAFAGLLDTGRRDIARLHRRVELALTPSRFNACELETMGYRDVRVWPLIVDYRRMQSVPPDSGVAEWLATLDGPLLLFVGQLLPHKRPDFLAQAFHVLSTYLLPEAHLMVVGASRVPTYARRLVTFIDELNLPRLHRLGHVTDAQLAAHWRAADAFVTASEHEGFLVPLVEAMGFDLPIVARGFGAIPETMGRAGVLLEGGDGPEVLAEAMCEVLTNETLRGGLIEAGRSRRADFDPDDSRRAFLRHLLDVA